MKDFIKQKAVKLTIPDMIVRVNYYWQPSVNSNGCTLLLLPGLDESINDYQVFILKMVEMFPHYSILAIDLRGQGATFLYEEKINSFKIPMSNQITIIKDITTSLSITSLFVIGLSYGAGVALCAANKLDNIKGLALFAPYVSKFKNFKHGFVGIWYSLVHLNPFYKTLAHFSLPLYFRSARDKGLLNPSVIWSRNRLEALTKLTTGILDISTNHEAKLIYPMSLGVHLMLGDKDQVVSISAVEQLFNELDCDNKTITIIPNLDHRLLVNNVDICCEWISKILPLNPPNPLQEELEINKKAI
jgi:pimeloyl-ACP methyl ester carboxylesterase